MLAPPPPKPPVVMVPALDEPPFAPIPVTAMAHVPSGTVVLITPGVVNEKLVMLGAGSACKGDTDAKKKLAADTAATALEKTLRAIAVFCEMLAAGQFCVLAVMTMLLLPQRGKIAYLPILKTP